MTVTDVVASVALTVAVVALARAYVAAERFFYYWDWAGFHGIAADLAERLTADFGDGLRFFSERMKTEYNLVFALPLVPLLAAAESTRSAYVTAVAGLYLVPFAVLTGVVCRRAFPALGQLALWGGAVLAVAVPPVWLTVVRGYPDVMAAAFLMAALAVLMGDVRLERWRSILAIALLLSVAVTIRRHVAYAAVALLFTAGFLVLRHWLDVRRQDGAAAMKRDLRHRLPRALALPVAALGFLALLNPAFIGNLLHNDYASLYSSYRRPAPELLSLFREEMLGPVFFALGVLGLLLGGWRGRLRCTPDSALTIYLSAWLAIWLIAVGQDGEHQLIAGLPMLAIAGVLQCADVADTRGWAKTRSAWLAAAVAYAVVTAVIANGPVSLYLSVQNATELLPSYTGPLRRGDFEELRSLVAALREGPQPVLIAASSSMLNFDLVDKAEARLFGRADRRLRILVSPQIDSRDPLPVDDLLRAGQVVVVTPFQYHLARDSEQDVVRVLVDAFAEHWPVARDFRESERRYHLDGGVAQVYSRERASSVATAVDSYERVVAVTGEPAPQYRDAWLASTSEPPVGIARGGGTSFYYPVHALDAGPVTLTLLRALRGPQQLSGAVRADGPSCEGIRVEAVDAMSGRVFGGADATVGVSTPFVFSLDGADETFVQLVGRRIGEGSCFFNAEKLRVLPAPGSALQTR